MEKSIPNLKVRSIRAENGKKFGNISIEGNTMSSTCVILDLLFIFFFVRFLEKLKQSLNRQSLTRNEYFHMNFCIIK